MRHSGISTLCGRRPDSTCLRIHPDVIRQAVDQPEFAGERRRYIDVVSEEFPVEEKEPGRIAPAVRIPPQPAFGSPQGKPAWSSSLVWKSTSNRPPRQSIHGLPIRFGKTVQSALADGRSPPAGFASRLYPRNARTAICPTILRSVWPNRRCSAVAVRAVMSPSAETRWK